MSKRLLGSLAVLTVIVLGCEVPAPPPAPTPYEPPDRVVMHVEVVHPQPVASRPYEGDWHHYAEPKMTVWDSHLNGVSCSVTFIKENFKYETKKVTRTDGVKLELWLMGGTAEFSVRNSTYCWKEDEMPAALYRLWGKATYTNEPRPHLSTTTTTVPCGDPDWVPTGNAGETPGLCSEPFGPTYRRVNLNPQPGGVRFVK